VLAIDTQRGVTDGRCFGCRAEGENFAWKLERGGRIALCNRCGNFMSERRIAETARALNIPPDRITVFRTDVDRVEQTVAKTVIARLFILYAEDLEHVRTVREAETACSLCHRPAGERALYAYKGFRCWLCPECFLSGVEARDRMRRLSGQSRSR